MRQAAEDGHVAAMRFKRFERLGQAIVGTVGVGEPVPILVVRLVPPRQRDAVAEEDGAESLWPLGRLLRMRHGFEPRQRQRQSGAAEEGSSIEMPGGARHGGFPLWLLRLKQVTCGHQP
jgi:hypothetical protein